MKSQDPGSAVKRNLFDRATINLVVNIGDNMHIYASDTGCVNILHTPP